jgi:O-antigen/teichoic acid export membrane protein
MVNRLEVMTRRRVINLGRFSPSLIVLQQGSWMLFATVITGVLNYLSNMFMGRMLGPSDYGVFAALLALFNLWMALTGVAQTVVTNYTARLAALNDWPGLRGLAWGAFCWIAIVGLIASVGISMGIGWISNALQIISPGPVLVLAATLLPTAWMSLGLGILRGQQRFGMFGGALVSGAMLRLVGGVALVLLGAGVVGAMASLVFAPLASIAIAVIALTDVWKNRKERSSPRLEALGKFVGYAAVGTLCYTLLTSIDMLVVRGRFTSLEYGLYAAVATVGKTTLWVSGAFVAIFFPKVVARSALEQSTVPLLRIAQMAVLGLCGSATLVFFLAGPQVMRVLYGEKYLELAHLLGLYGLAMTLYALVSLWFNYFFALKKTAYIWMLVAGVFIQTAILYLVASDPNRIIVGMIWGGFGLVMAGEILLRLLTLKLVWSKET